MSRQFLFEQAKYRVYNEHAENGEYQLCSERKRNNPVHDILHASL